MTTSYSIGIDPGWKNAGVCLIENTDGRLKLVHSATLNPSLYSDKERCSKVLSELTSKVPIELISSVGIERYVAYKGIHTADSEKIIMLIGSLVERVNIETQGACGILLYRAVDWKVALVKQLAKYRGFSNPSDSLDKKFSIAAAKACLDLPGTFKTDHEADSICIASLPFIQQRL